MITLPLTPGATRDIPTSGQYPGLFALAIDETREIVAVGEEAERVVREAVEGRAQ